MSNTKKNFNGTLKIKTKTWEKESYGLFDFEAKDIFCHEFEIERPISIIREQNKINVEKNTKMSKETDLESLCKISKSNGEFYISKWKENINTCFNSKDLWMVIGSKSIESKKNHLLQENDVFKVGRMAFKILQIRTNQTIDKSNYHSLSDSVKLHYQQNVNFVAERDIFLRSQELTNRSSNNKMCRICLSESNDFENPLFSPCLCSGSLKFIHFKCLQTWVQSRLHLDRKNGIISIEWTAFTCELCKGNLPLSFKHDNLDYDLLELREQNKENFKNFIVLKSYSKHFKISGIHYIDFTERNSISLGRAENTDIKLNDISVSREHARILFDHGKFYLKDISSKFGTLVLVTTSVKLSSSKQVFQNGRTVLAAKIQTSWLSYFSFCPFAYITNESLVKNVPKKNNKIVYYLIK